MRYFATVFSVLFVAVTIGGCGSDSSSDVPTAPSPVAVTETFSATLTVNGLRVHAFTVERAGTAAAQLKTLSDPAATVGLSLGTWNGVACQIVITNPAAVLNTTVTGTAQNTGQFCVMINDVGKLTAAVDYSVDVTHY